MEPQIVAAIIAAVTALVVSIVQTVRAADAKKKESEARDQIRITQRGLIEPVQIHAQDRRNSIMLLGLGGTGKTSIIRQIFHDPHADPTKKTQRYDLYQHSLSLVANGEGSDPSIRAGEVSVASTHAVMNGPMYRLYIADYKGQNIGTLIRAFIQQQKILFSPMAYGFINSLVLIVDIFPPTASADTPDKEPVAEPDLERVKLGLDQWNDLMLDAVFGLLTKDTFTYACLFINKLDLIADQTIQSRKKIERLFDPLIQRLKQRLPEGTELDVILGSARRGDGVPMLEDKLLKHAVQNVRRDSKLLDDQ